jgi:UPF0755 protein
VPEPRVRRHTPLRSVVYSVFGTLFALILVVAAGLVWGYSRALAPGPLGEPRIVLVERGAKSEEIAQMLEREGVVENAREFLAIIWATRYHAPALKAGEYEIPARASMRDVLALIRAGRSITYKITLPEGWTSEQLLERLRAHPVLTGEITRQVAEGSLLPDTYVFQRGTTRDDLIARMQEAQKRVVGELWKARSDDLPVATPEEAVILASIVEKETAIAEERPRVAAVFVNRLKKRMRLQSDPTIIYGIVGGKGRLDRPLTRSDIAEKTPYNTYQIDGLPPTPIANPGRDSLAAVLRPPASKEVYFVADGTGGHVFSETLKEHQENVRRWRLVERELGEAEDSIAEDKTATLQPPPEEGDRTAGRRLVAAVEQKVGETVAPDPARNTQQAAARTIASPTEKTELPPPEETQAAEKSGEVVAAEGGKEVAKTPETSEAQKTPEPLPAPSDLTVVTPGKLVKIAGHLVPLPRPRPQR